MASRGKQKHVPFALSDSEDESVTSSSDDEKRRNNDDSDDDSGKLDFLCEPKLI